MELIEGNKKFEEFCKENGVTEFNYKTRRGNRVMEVSEAEGNFCLTIGEVTYEPGFLQVVSDGMFGGQEIEQAIACL